MLSILNLVLSLNLFHWIPQIIEKRRRDRINHSLSELRRLVPSAFEKQVRPSQFSASVLLQAVQNIIECTFSLTVQGSSKLEKAEILQMTVDHLKLLHAMGGKGEEENCTHKIEIVENTEFNKFIQAKPVNKEKPQIFSQPKKLIKKTFVKQITN